MRQRQAGGQLWAALNVRVPVEIYEFIKIQSHNKNLSMGAYVAQVFAEKKNEALGKKK